MCSRVRFHLERSDKVQIFVDYVIEVVSDVSESFLMILHKHVDVAVLSLLDLMNLRLAS